MHFFFPYADALHQMELPLVSIMVFIQISYPKSIKNHVTNLKSQKVP